MTRLIGRQVNSERPQWPQVESGHLNSVPYRLTASLSLLLIPHNNPPLCSLCACVCVCACACVHALECTDVETRDQHHVSSSVTIHLILQWVSMNIEITDLATLAGQQASGLFLSPHSAGNSGKHHCAWFYTVLGLNSGLCACTASTFPTDPPS